MILVLSLNDLFEVLLVRWSGPLYNKVRIVFPYAKKFQAFELGFDLKLNHVRRCAL